MAIRIGAAGAVAAVLLLAGCTTASQTPTESMAPATAPVLAIPRMHHDAMRDRAAAYCEPFGGEPVLVDWRYRSTFGKRGEWVLQTVWACREPAA